jgi:hypothetical protein
VIRRTAPLPRRARDARIRRVHLPRALPGPAAPFAPAARRTLVAFGAPVELVLVPERAARRGRPGDVRPAFDRSPAARIVEGETRWRGEGLALTPNKYPFAHEQRILWPGEPMREHPIALWQAVCDWTAATGGSALVNTIGAASSIARAHAHLTPERLPFLEALRERAVVADLADLPAGARLVAKDVPFCLLGVRGDAAAVAESVWRLAEARLTPAWNVVVEPGAAWSYPRTAETPAPYFPYALGAAEVWGRWCYLDHAAFAAATGADLERALVAAGAAPL